ncbi:MAG: hypothetical protein MZV63_34445 [Marinilabiliales bacterium]|nr:hypothetical protein [Marinilabiliales bacterium]
MGRTAAASQRFPGSLAGVGALHRGHRENSGRSVCWATTPGRSTWPSTLPEPFSSSFPTFHPSVVRKSSESFLGGFLFTGDDVEKPTRVLSGEEEQGRLARRHAASEPADPR